MKGGQSCFQQTAAEVFFSHKSDCSAPSPARWGDSVLSTALCPGYLLWDPPPALLWEISFSLLDFVTLLTSAGCHQLL
jgi:hypothetical protein